jgi:hypothetical protein
VAKKNGSEKENTSFSIRSTTIETLTNFCSLREVDNKSAFVDEAIREKIGREITVNPLAFKRLSSLLEGMTS